MLTPAKWIRVSALVIGLAAYWSTERAVSAEHALKIVTRIEHVTVMKKGRKLIIQADGMGTTKARFGRGGELLPRNQDHQPNKEGLLEYDLMFNDPQHYSGFDLKPIKASRKETSIPGGVKGVRVFSEYNHMDGLIPEPKKKQGFRLFGGHPKEQPQ